MRMLERCVHSKSPYWVLASIIFAFVGIACFIVDLQISAEQYSFSLFHESRQDGWLSLIDSFFPLISIVLGFIAFVKISKNWKARKLASVVQVLIPFFMGFCFFGIYFVVPEFYRLPKAVARSGLRSIYHISGLADKYVKENGRVPDSHNWCDSFINNEYYTNEEYFSIPQFEMKCNFAFNENLSHLPVKDLAGNLVLIFEADGDWNLSGGPELVNKAREKDKYFVFKKDIFIYVLFVDGTIAKYRLRDGSVAKYDKDMDVFTNYFPQGKTPYSPLRWK